MPVTLCLPLRLSPQKCKKTPAVMSFTASREARSDFPQITAQSQIIPRS